jgi:hypothetical protein
MVITQFLRQLLTDGDAIFIRPRVYMELYWRKIDAYFWYSNGLIYGSFLLQIDAFLRVKNDLISGAKLSSFYTLFLMKYLILFDQVFYCFTRAFLTSNWSAICLAILYLFSL